MKTYYSEGMICYKNKLNIEFSLCKIEYYLNEDETFKYVFRPNYDVIDLLKKDNHFQGIPGLDLSLRRKEYIRDDRVPVFISERVPQENRVDYYKLLKKVHMDYMDPIEYLIRTKMRYSGDTLYVKRCQNKKHINLKDDNSKTNNFGLIKNILDNLASNNDVVLPDKTVISDSETFETLSFLYEKSLKNLSKEQKIGIEKAKQEDKYKGRKPIHVETSAFLGQLDLVEKGTISAKDAAKNLGISIDKYYRERKKYQELGMIHKTHH